MKNEILGQNFAQQEEFAVEETNKKAVKTVGDKKTILKEYVVITIGIFLASLAIYFFMIPGNIIFGSIFDENMEDEMRVTVIATGFDDADEEPEVPSFSQISSQVTQQEPAPAPVPEPTPAPAPQTPQESFFQAVEFDPFSTATQQKAAPAPEQPKAAPAKKDPFDDLMEMFNRRK